MKREYDVEVDNQGTLHIVHPLTDAATDWLEENTEGTWSGGLVVEPRYTVDLLLGMRDAGFNVPLEKRV